MSMQHHVRTANTSCTYTHTDSYKSVTSALKNHQTAEQVHVNIVVNYFYSALGMDVKYCDQCVCISV